jgi:hypothetical protein
LIVAAGLESGGDARSAAVSVGGARAWLVVGALVLTLYGFVVNLNRAVDSARSWAPTSRSSSS